MPSSSLQLAQQIEDLRLDGDVERGGRLVGDQQLRPAGERHGDHHPLAQAAGQLDADIAPDRRSGRADADLSQHLERARAAPRAARRSAMQPQHLGDLVADGEGRIEAGHRLLEDHADAVAPDLRASGSLVEREQIACRRTGLRPPAMRAGGDRAAAA